MNKDEKDEKDKKDEKESKTYLPTGTGKLDEIRMRKMHRQYSLEEQVKGNHAMDYEDWIKDLNK